MFDEQRTKIYVGLSFALGVLLTLGFKDVYPDLERRYHQRRRRFSTLGLGTSIRPDQKVTLKDNDHRASVVTMPEVEIGEGIESTIGNTPLFRIKSLSDATGCEILAKAEVMTTNHSCPALIFTLLQFLNGAGQSPKDRVALNIIKMISNPSFLSAHTSNLTHPTPKKKPS
jgi:cysteine synthase